MNFVMNYLTNFLAKSEILQLHFLFITRKRSTRAAKKYCTEGPLPTLFFKTLEKQPCKRRRDLALNGQMRVPK